ncbi:MAG TPA: lasso peptide biosynthesis B2 protein [Vicinamibacterales bacterium]|nr:lasso peptide biosynthesis B2 protein [Vicinamibacterales bacterium]
MATTSLLQSLATAVGIGRLLPMYAAFGALRYVVPLPTLARWAWQAPSAPRDLAREQRMVARVTWVQAHVARLRPRGDCLHRSLLLYRELSRSGADPMLVVGFRQAGGRIVGHAWVLADGGPVAESAEAVEAFTPALAFGRDGALRASAPGYASASSGGPDDAAWFI